MANADKNILITPATNTSNFPKIEYTPFAGSGYRTTMQVLDDGTLEWSNPNGTLFAITPDFAGTFYSVSDGSGVPFIEASDDNTVVIGASSGLTTLIGTATNNYPSAALQIGGNTVSSGTIEATRFISTQATGTAPLTVASTTVVSNLNADLLDGIQGSSFVRSDAADTMTGMLTLNHAGDEMIRLQDTSSTGSPYLSLYQGTIRSAYIQYVNGVGLRLFNDVSDDYLDIRSGLNGLQYYGDGGPYTVWHAGNDGPGSALDADTLDGQQLLSIQKQISRSVGWVPAYGSAIEDSVYWDFNEQATAIYYSGDTSTGAAFKAERIGENDTYEISVTVRAGAAVTTGLYLRVYEYNAELPPGKTHVSENAASSPAYVQQMSSGKTDWVENGALGTSWITYTYSYSPSTSAKYASVVMLNWSGSTAAMYVHEPRWRVVSNFADAGSGGGGGATTEEIIAYANALAY